MKERPMTCTVTAWQILSQNPERTASFYADVFDWTVQRNNPLDYRELRSGAPHAVDGGVWPAPPEGHAFVQLFIQVDDLPRRLARAEERGAKVLIAPQTLPDGDELAILLDPDGVAFGMMRRAVRS
jgi:predicted enzyme related to lactoylglutathione lyase